MLLTVPLEEYNRACLLLDEIRAPAARRRALLRDPDKQLAEILAQEVLIINTIKSA